MSKTGRSVLFRLHKYISFTLLAIWTVQVLTGVILVFAPEINDIRFSRAHVDLDISALEAAIAERDAALPDWTPELVFSAGPEASRFDVYFYHENSSEIGSRAIRFNGDGEILADRRMRYDILNRLSEIHEDFWLGDWGYRLLGLSGVFLVSNLVIGLLMVWPARATWARYFKTPGALPLRLKATQWHKALGLIVIIPALFLASTGAMNSFLGDMKTAFGDPWAAPEITAVPAEEFVNPISLSDAVKIAWRTYPGAALSIISLPTPESPVYMIRLLQEGEIREVYGNTKMYIHAMDGTVLANYDQLNASVKASVFSSFFSLHMVQFLGIFGKIAAFLTGLSLLTMGGLGLTIWQQKRAMKRKSAG